MGLKKYAKRLGKKAKKAIKSAGRVGAKVVKYAAIPAGLVVAGPLGAAAGTALSAAAARVGAKNKRKASLRMLKIGGAVTAGGALATVIAGQSLTTPILSSLGKLLAPSPSTPASKLDDVFLTSEEVSRGSGGLEDAFLTGGSPPVPTGAAGVPGGGLLDSVTQFFLPASSVTPGTGTQGVQGPGAPEISYAGGIPTQESLAQLTGMQSPVADPSDMSMSAAGGGGSNRGALIVLAGAALLLYLFLRKRRAS